MCSLVFQIDAHQLECQHIREYSRATAGHQSTVLQLAVKEYRPLDNLNPSEGDITIIGAHANGFPKEMYEPLWESLYHHLKRSGTNIRAIWIADVAHQGHSGVLNEHLLGNDPSGFDHSRDLLQMVNHFRAKMPRPIVGVGHSMGGCQLVQLSLIHPRLLSTLVLLDPVIQPQVADHGPSPTLMSTFRRDVWPSRAVAEVAFSKNKVYQQWHPHVFEKWKEYGLREDPTALIPYAKEGHATTTSTQESSVTLSTTKHQEVFTYLRPYHASASKDGVMIIERAEAPDLSPSAAQRLTSDKVDGRRTLHFYRPEQHITYLNLPHLRPSVLYIFGGKSDISQPQFQDAKMAATGSGVGGSGGAKEGKVAKVVLENAGHLVPFEEVDLSAIHCAQWLHTESEMVREEDAKFYKWWGGLSLSDKTKTGDDWREYMMKERKKMEKL